MMDMDIDSYECFNFHLNMTQIIMSAFLYHNYIMITEIEAVPLAKWTKTLGGSTVGNSLLIVTIEKSSHSTRPM